MAFTPAPSVAPGDACARVRLVCRPPFDSAALGAFFLQRQINGVEQVDLDADTGTFTLGRTLAIQAGALTHAGWLRARVGLNPPGRPSGESHGEQFESTSGNRCCVELQVGNTLRPALPVVIQRVRQLFDLDADPHAIHQVLGADFPHGEGLRVPGTLDGFELAVRAVLGQQITVAAARTLAQRLVHRLGTPINTPYPALHRLFPDPAQLASADSDTLGSLGIVRMRQRAIHALAQAVANGQLHLGAGVDVATTMAQLTALPGIGDWTAHYIAMRALRWPDAFPSGDVALHKALGVRDAPHPARAADARSQAWRPWRSYAVLRAWHTPPAGKQRDAIQGD